MNQENNILNEKYFQSIVLTLISGLSTGIGGLVVVLFKKPNNMQIGLLFLIDY
jgi:hypothetical protein